VKFSAHIMDRVFGIPAADLCIVLRRQQNAEWLLVKSGQTGADGRVADWPGQNFHVGIYQLEIEIDGYYSSMGMTALNPRVIVEFQAFDSRVDLHMEILITTNSFQVYQEISGSIDPT